MARVTYVEPDGTEQTVEVPNSTPVMRGAIDNGIEGIVAECGGCCMCATCHVYVDEEFLALLPAQSEEEKEMLEEAAAEVRETSRLSCQIPVSDELDGLVVRTPETQG